MNAPSKLTNGQRIEEAISALVKGQSIEFAQANTDLIVIFDDPVNEFSGGRIAAFQNYFYNSSGLVPEIIKQIPACLKVFFSTNDKDRLRTREIMDVLESEYFSQIYKVLGISYVQFRGQIAKQFRQKGHHRPAAPHP